MLKTLIIALVLFFFSTCKHDELASLDIKIEMQNKHNPSYADIYSLTVLQDGKVFKSFTADRLPFISHQINLEKLSLGTYDFEYLNVLDQLITKRLIISSPGKYNISIYPDSSNYQKNRSRTFVHNLGASDTLHILYNSTGCFHFTNDSLILVRTQKKYYLIRGKKKIVLTAHDVDLLVKFESDLMELPTNRDCTTTDTYRFNTGGDTTRYTDNTCCLNAWNVLTKTLNLKRNAKIE